MHGQRDCSLIIFSMQLLPQPAPHDVFLPMSLRASKSDTFEYGMSLVIVCQNAPHGIGKLTVRLTIRWKAAL